MSSGRACSVFTAWFLFVVAMEVPFTGCATLPGLGPNLGVIEDPSLRSWLSSLTLVEDQGCTLTVAGRHMTMRCRVFRGPADERIVGAYDIVTDRPVVVLLLHEDGRQQILWRPARQERPGDPEVAL